MTSPLATEDYVEEMLRDKVVPAGALGYADLGIVPQKVTDGLAIEPVRHARVGGYRWVVAAWVRGTGRDKGEGAGETSLSFAEWTRGTDSSTRTCSWLLQVGRYVGGGQGHPGVGPEVLQHQAVRAQTHPSTALEAPQRYVLLVLWRHCVPAGAYLRHGLGT